MTKGIIAFDHTDAGDDPFSGLITHSLPTAGRDAEQVIPKNKKSGLSKK